MGGAALIAAVNCVCGGGGGRGECVCGYVGMGVGVIAWVRKAVCGWGSLDCCRKVCVCGGRGGVNVWVWV